MNPSQLRETTMDPDTRRLVQLVLDADDDTNSVFDMLLAKSARVTGANGSNLRATSPTYNPSWF